MCEHFKSTVNLDESKEYLLLPKEEWRHLNNSIYRNGWIFYLDKNSSLSLNFNRRVKMVRGSGTRKLQTKRGKSKCKPASSTEMSKTNEVNGHKFQGKLSHSSPARSQRQISDFFTPTTTSVETKTNDKESEEENVYVAPTVRTSPRKHPPNGISYFPVSNGKVQTEGRESHTPHKIQFCDGDDDDEEEITSMTMSPSCALSELAIQSPKKLTKTRRRLNISQMSNQQQEPPPKVKVQLEDTTKTQKNQKEILSNVNLSNHVPKTTNGCSINLLKDLNVTNHKLTEYFPVRRSVRKTKKTVMEEKEKCFQEAVLSQKEDGLEVHNFEGKGRGVVTTRKFTRGEYVVEYAGELINMVNARRREEDYAQDQNTGCYMYYFKHNNVQYCIDATCESGRLGRLVNHSRNGNLNTKIVTIGTSPHLVLVARDDIDVGQEVTYDYGDRSKESLKYHPWLAS